MADLRTGRSRHGLELLTVLLAGWMLLALAPAALAQDDSAGDEEKASEEKQAPAAKPKEDLSFFASTSVTATGSSTDTFDLPNPVIVIDAEKIEESQPDNAADLLRGEPGVDVNGIGPNQARPVIRGQRGLRILFLENGLRMNNARRQTDFGEITGLVDIDNVQTMEVVRGPASVLYGSDAIGGVLNLITKVPPAGNNKFGLDLSLRGSTADDQTKGSINLFGRSGKASYQIGVSKRDASDYEAPAGTFGDITLADDTTVIDTGLTDDSVTGYFGYRVNDHHAISLRLNRYRADRTGFGYVDPELIGDTSGFRIAIVYPYQDFDRYTFGYEASGLQAALATTVNFQVYSQKNKRELANDIFINIGPAFGPGTGPDSDVQADTLNYTNLDTFGFRAELTKILGNDNLLTYGAEYFEDDSFNTDHSTTTTTLRAYFPIDFICGPAGAVPFPFECVFVQTDDVANAPNASNSGYGVFVQDTWNATDKLTAIAGLRYAKSKTNAEPTPGWDITGLDFDDDAVVGSLSLIYGVSPNVNLVGSYATAFRAPNIIERLFNGLTPEGAGFQVLNPDLTSETSKNYDFGIKYRRLNGYFEATYFHTEVDDAIIQHTLSDAEIDALPPDIQEQIDNASVGVVVQQRNAQVLTIKGVELAGAYRFDCGASIGGNYTHLSGEAESGGPAADPTGDTFSDKYNLWLRYDQRQGRYWLEYRFRRNGEEDINFDPAETPGPLGEVLPAFTIHRLAGGVTLFSNDVQEHVLGVIVDNVTNELYAEFSNATFFRPQPKRNYILTYTLHLK